MFVGSCAGVFLSLDRQTGAVVWQHDASLDSAQPQFHGDALVAGDMVVVGSDAMPEGYLYGFDARTGDLLWQHGFPGGVPVDVLAQGDLLYATSVSGEAMAITIASGAVKWLVNGPPEVLDRNPADPALSNGVYYAAWLPGVILALDANTGDRLWERNLGVTINTSVTAISSGLLVGTLDGTIRLLSLDSGETLDSLETDGAPYGTIVTAGDQAIVMWAGGGHDESMTLHGPHVLASISPSLDIVWRHEEGAEWSTHQPLVDDSTVVVGFEGQIMALGLADGKTAWTNPMDGTPRGLGSSASVLLVGTLQGTVYAFEASQAGSRVGSQN